MTPPIAIIGAGEGGLTLARFLEINSIDYVVFEQNSSSTDAGFWGTLDIQPETAQVVLKEAGLWEKFEAVAKYETQTIALFDLHGEIISRSDIEYLPQIDWTDLRALLIESIPEGKIKWDCQVDSIERHHQGSVSVRFSNGTVESGFKLVIGADGIWSKVRQSITSVSPRYFGITCLRTSISFESDFWSTIGGQLKPTNYMAIGQGKTIVGQRNVAGTYSVLICLPLAEGWNDPDLNNPLAFRDKLIKNEFNHWAVRVLNWVRHADGEFAVFPLYTMPKDSLSWESLGGVTVIGDAAHPSTPWGGESMGWAMYDAFQLAQQIVKYGTDDLDQAVSEYERQMLPRAIDLVGKSNEIGDVFFSKDAASVIGSLIT